MRRTRRPQEARGEDVFLELSLMTMVTTSTARQFRTSECGFC